MGMSVLWWVLRRIVVTANRAGQSPVDGRVEDAEVDVVEVKLGHEVYGHPVGDDPQVVQGIHFDIAGEDHGFVVPVDYAQVLGLVREPGIPAAHGVPVNQVEIENTVVGHVMGGNVTAGTSGLQHDKIVVDLLGRQRGISQDFRGHGEFAVTGQRMEEQHAETVLGDWRQSDTKHAFFAPLEIDACNFS